MKMLRSTAPALLPIATVVSVALAASVGHAQSDRESETASDPKLASLHSLQRSHSHSSDVRHQHPLQPLLAWAEAGQERILLEEYTYHELELNVGLTDEDFDRGHPDYHFSQ